MSQSTSSNMEIRFRYAELLRHFMSGRMTNDEYEDAAFALLPRGVDCPEFWKIFRAAWFLYDDMHEHRMTPADGHQLSPEIRRRVARWIVFLRSGARLSAASQTRVPGWRYMMSGVALWFLMFVEIVAMVVGFGTSLSTIGLTSIGLAIWAFGLRMTRELARECTQAFSDDPCDSWPFATQDDLATAAAHPTFLHG